MFPVCTGTAQAYFQGSKFAQLSETYGYVVLFPSSVSPSLPLCSAPYRSRTHAQHAQPHSGTCWDVSSDATLKHDGGGDSLGIASAVRYALQNWGVDASKVFAVGTSSGAMLTNVLAGAYPDVLGAGVVDSGVAFGCFALLGQPDNSWSEQRALGELVLTG